MMDRRHNIAEMCQVFHAVGAVQLEAVVVRFAMAARRHDAAFDKPFREFQTAFQFRGERRLHDMGQLA